MSGESDVRRTFAAAMAHHRAGRLAQAEALFLEVLAADPDHADSLHRRGLIALQERRPQDAVVLIERAIALTQAAPQADFHTSVAAAYRWLGRTHDAADHYREAFLLQPADADACLNFGVVLREQGDLDNALVVLQRALTIRPDDPQILYHQGLTLKAQGLSSPAAEAYRAAIALKPGFAQAHGALGIVLREEGRLAESEAACREAVRLDPDSPGPRNVLGNALKARGDLDGAAAAYRWALALSPEHAAARYNLGLVLKDQGHKDEAIACFQRALTLKRDFAEAKIALVMAELPALYRTTEEIEASRKAYRARLQRLFDDTTDQMAAADLAEGVGSSQPLFLAYQGRDDRDLQSLYGGLIGWAMASRYTAPALPEPPRPDEQVRVGIVSGDFCDHPVWRLQIQGWLSRLDRSRFRLFGYHLGAARDDQTLLASSLCERFVQGPLSTQGWREAIAADQPHVLIYPEIGMDPMAVRLAAQRLAPAQCVSWGHPVTSGVPTLDYFLTSDVMEPEGAELAYTEELVRLPGLSVYLEPPEPLTVEVSRADMGLRETAVAYWCGQPLQNYLPEHDAVFARIAEATGDCQFVFLEFPGGLSQTAIFAHRLTQAFAARGLESQRHCLFLARPDSDRLAAAMGQCDVVLDSIGWSGGPSLLESLRHDLPIVTLAGPLMRGRQGAAILTIMDARETLVESVEDYVAAAVRLGRDKNWRAQVGAAVAFGKHRLYRDRACIDTLEAFLEWAAGKAVAPR